MKTDVFLQSFAIFFEQPLMLLVAVFAVAAGIIMGALPGVSSTMALAILLPITFGLEPNIAIMLLILVLVSSVFGGSISAILINIPGTPGAIVTQFDGYPMARQGKAGLALGHALIGSTVGGVLGVFALMLIAPVIAQSAMSFRSPEFAMLALFGIVLLAYTAEGAMLAGLLSGAIGLMLGMVGFDTVTGVARYEFGTSVLQNGIHLIPLTIGIFGFSEVLCNLMDAKTRVRSQVSAIQRIIPSRLELLNVWPSWLRGSAIGTLVGAIPAAGSAISVAIAYALERRFTRRPLVGFGKGEPRGIAAPEAANSAASGGTTIPMVTLGIPGDSMTAILIGALIIHGLQPGPTLFAENPEIVGAIYGSLFLGVLLTFLIGLVALRWIVHVLKLPSNVMMVLIALLCMVGTYAIRNNMVDLVGMIVIGGMGFMMIRLNIPIAPLVFGLILGPLLEENLRRSLMISRGSWTVFLERPVSLAIILIIVLVFVASFIGWMRKRKRSAPEILPGSARPSKD